MSSRDEQIRTLAREIIDSTIRENGSGEEVFLGEGYGADEILVTKITAALRSLAVTVEQETREQDAPYLEHLYDCAKWVDYDDEYAGRWFNDETECTCGLDAIRQQGQEDR